MQTPLSDRELKNRALAAARRAADSLHADERELSARPEYEEGAELARSAAEAADRVAKLLDMLAPKPDTNNTNPS